MKEQGFSAKKYKVECISVQTGLEVIRDDGNRALWITGAEGVRRLTGVSPFSDSGNKRTVLRNTGEEVEWRWNLLKSERLARDKDGKKHPATGHDKDFIIALSRIFDFSVLLAVLATLIMVALY